jgi:hypothetical protein
MSHRARWGLPSWLRLRETNFHQSIVGSQIAIRVGRTHAAKQERCHQGRCAQRAPAMRCARLFEGSHMSKSGDERLRPASRPARRALMIARVLIAAVVTADANLHQTKSTFASNLEFLRKHIRLGRMGRREPIGNRRALGAMSVANRLIVRDVTRQRIGGRGGRCEEERYDQDTAGFIVRVPHAAPRHIDDIHRRCSPALRLLRE